MTVIDRLRVFLVLSAITVVALALSPLQLLALKFDWPIRRWLPGIWHRFACRALGFRIRVIGAPDTRRPLMLAATHVSWKDILILGSLVDVAFIAKTEVRDWPVFGYLARLQHSIFVARDNRRGASAQVDEIAARMAKGEIVVLFPEGTTSDGNRVLPVKSSLFGAATAALPSAPDGVVHVQPVTIAYTGVYGLPMGRYHRPLAGWPGEVELVPHVMGVLKAGALDIEVSFGDPVDFRAGDSRKALAAGIETDLRRMLNDSLRGRNRRR